MSQEPNANSHAASKENSKKQNSTNNGNTTGDSELHMATRIYEIPVVQDSVNAVRSYIEHSNSRYVHLVADTANSAFSTVTKAIKPVQTHFQRQIQQVDDIGCKSLDYLEGKFPIIKKPTNEVIETCRSTLEPYVGNFAATAQNLLNNVRNALPGH
ncbi:hypothetical protein K493DRAFT_315494 [Basidiobolus meristosporus CBS 931.73]|uniref:Uncharacterized protein n=1 Tax=Basidiobolus meristosporus CBS 931.73 TaxID=1314790 RepID=A0A1Y1Y8U3_9FUNG|nr:hypothetical protein K493DRAFT_315494 [Basidiobolus meristosporus CBS 931.73]|eukprot:ORX94441.1 hypothetical protein K493DRAFT_315494 [Basidiobolus meristosporus CBS 931.73]